MTQKYSRPPVVQAVIEVKFSNPLQVEDLDRLKAKLAGRFPKVEDLIEVQFMFLAQIGGRPDLRQNANGFKMTAGDATQVVQVSRGSLAVHQFAPYGGWDNLIELFNLVYRPAKKIFGAKTVERLGIRFINRFDLDEPEVFRAEDYVSVKLDFPAQINPSSRFMVVYDTMIGERPFGLKITSGSTESPLVDHVGLLLDLDIYAMVDLPKFDADIMAVLDEMRVHKNNVFEMLITDKARGLLEVGDRHDL